MTDNVNAVQGKSQEDLLHKTISHLSAEQINELYNHLFPLRNILNDVNSEALKTISEGKIDLPAVDQITSLLDKAEKMSQSKTVTDQKVQALFSTFTVTDLVNALKKEQIKHDSYKGMSDDDLMPF